MLMKRVVILVGLLITVPSVMAYIDPGTGSAIAGSIWPFILMVLGAIGAFFVKYFFKPIKNACTKVWSFIVRK